jgi:transposase
MALLPLEKPPVSAIFSTTRNRARTLAAQGAGTGFVVGQAFQPDIPNVRLESLTYSKVSTMCKEERTSLQSELAAALAAGKSCAEWASANGVSERTAQRWASDPEVRAEVEAYRRGNLDEAVGRMSRRTAWATDQIAELAEKARSESVRLAALRSMLSDMMAVADFAGLEQRIAKLEEQDRVRHEENASAAN